MPVFRKMQIRFVRKSRQGRSKQEFQPWGATTEWCLVSPDGDQRVRAGPGPASRRRRIPRGCRPWSSL